MNNSRSLFLLLPLLFSAVPLFAQDHPNFTGASKLNVAESEMGSEGPTKLLVEVDHRDPFLKYIARGIAGGQPFEETETFTTDGKTSRDSHGVNVKAYWDGVALVAAGTTDDGSLVFQSRLTLSSHRKTIARMFAQKDERNLRHEIYEKQ